VNLLQDGQKCAAVSLIQEESEEEAAAAVDADQVRDRSMFRGREAEGVAQVTQCRSEKAIARRTLHFIVVAHQHTLWS
jgi:hypothetical protein